MHNQNTEMDRIVTWQEALDLFTRLCGGKADITYGDRLIKSFRLPALEVRLDNPADLTPPEKQNGMHIWKHGRVAFGEQKSGHTDMDYIPDTGAAAAVYPVFLSLAELLELISASLPRELFQWAWYSIPVPTFCDDADLMAKRVRASCEKGAVLSLWLRCDTDEPIKAALRALPACGQVRLHNLTTANTWIAGSEDEEGLARTFGINS